MSEVSGLPAEFIGLLVKEDGDGSCNIDLNSYLRKREELPSNALFSQFRSMSILLGWLANSRLDSLFEIAQMCNVGRKTERSS